MGRPSKKHQYLGEVMRMYVKEKCSLGEIQDALGPSVQTLSRWLREEGVALEHRSRNPNLGRTPEQQAEINARVSASVRAAKQLNPGGRPVGPRIVRTCRCGNTFEVVPSSKQQNCSRSCAKSLQAERLSNNLRAAWESDERSLCACGNGRIPYEHRHVWRYCSVACRNAIGKKRQPNPENYATFNCLNCETEVTRRKGLGYHKYCSNACAAKHTKTKEHIVVDDAVVLDSSWEALFWGLCGFRKVPVERFDRENGFEWKSGAWYAPDFWLPFVGIAVEVKGVEDSNDVEKWAAFRTKFPLVVLDRGEMSQMLVATDIPAMLTLLAETQAQ
jgi:hypothetical protein